MAIVPLAIALAPMIPGLVESVTKIIKSIAGDPMTPEQYKAVLQKHIDNLDKLVADVKAVEIRDV